MEENFTMLKKTSCPAVLSENFFHDNIQDVEFITSDEGKAAVVKTHVDGIVEYFKNKK
jgi:N-acetylmuramoyl-L-alanine amidase